MPHVLATEVDTRVACLVLKEDVATDIHALLEHDFSAPQIAFCCACCVEALRMRGGRVCQLNATIRVHHL